MKKLKVSEGSFQKRDHSRKSLENFGYILIAEDMDEAIEAANEIASEHMEIVQPIPLK